MKGAKKLSELLADVDVPRGIEVNGITLNSRQVRPGTLFVALDGAKFSAESFVDEATQKGAPWILCERALNVAHGHSVVSDVRERLGQLSHEIYDRPSSKMTMIGVTGTNGKTTTSLMISHLLTTAGKKTAYLGTLGYNLGNEMVAQDRTSPEAPDLHERLSQMQERSFEAVSLECSSHGLSLGRLKSLQLDVAVFTNLTQDHLDFHKTMEAYAQAKLKLFTDVLEQSEKTMKAAVINLDDPYGERFSTLIQGKVLTYSVAREPRASVYAHHLETSLVGTRGQLVIDGKTFDFESPLVGLFNVSNALASIGAGRALGVPTELLLKGLQSFAGVPGRMERVKGQRPLHVFVDYAHTPDALENVLRTLRPICKGNIWTVFGCGGDRDKSKRPLMAAAVAKYSDQIILTSDNPRSEDPLVILEDMKLGLPRTVIDAKVFALMPDRSDAIAFAIEHAQDGDLVLIAGKGHETTQEIRGIKHPFHDVSVAAKYLGEAHG